MRKAMRYLSAAIVILATLTVVSSPAQAGGSRVVAVGDSFISGEGGTETGSYLPGSDTDTNRCHRSMSAPISILSWFTQQDVQTVACSGATTANITVAGQYGEPAQATQIARSATRVFVMVGGNDAGFSTLLGCYLNPNVDCPAEVTGAAVQFVATQLPKRLDAAYSAIRRAAPHAEVTVMLYPRLLPDNNQPTVTCSLLSHAELEAGNNFQTVLNSVINNRAGAHHFRVVDPSPAFKWHDVCQPTSFFYQPGMVPGPATYHPNLAGRTTMAATLATNR
jgi:lysophospholipase L1-like esterase